MHEDVFGLIGIEIDGRYRLDEVVGEGGFGVVYRGWHLRFERAIAVKCLKVPPHFTVEAKRLFFENFRNEGKLLSELSGKHLSIVRVYDFGVAESPANAQVPYLVLEWLVGRDLEVVLEERERRGVDAYTETEALALLRPAIEAIATAHTGTPPIAHRDLKPANLFIGEQESMTTVKVLDFGIAKAMQDGETATQVATRTSSGFSAFSPEYGAPEQFNPGKHGFGATGPWTDVHALGLILVRMLTGKPALDGENHYSLSVSAMSATRPTPRTRGAGRAVSDDLEALCSKALALRPADRYRSAAEMLAAVDALTSGAQRLTEVQTMLPAAAQHEHAVVRVRAEETTQSSSGPQQESSSHNGPENKTVTAAPPNTLSAGVEATTEKLEERSKLGLLSRRAAVALMVVVAAVVLAAALRPSTGEQAGPPSLGTKDAYGGVDSRREPPTAATNATRTADPVGIDLPANPSVPDPSAVTFPVAEPERSASEAKSTTDVESRPATEALDGGLSSGKWRSWDRTWFLYSLSTQDKQAICQGLEDQDNFPGGSVWKCDDHFQIRVGPFETRDALKELRTKQLANHLWTQVAYREFCKKIKHVDCP